MKKLVLLIIFILSINIVYAHQPRIVYGELTQIKNPGVSQAFYGILEGQPAYFQINSDKPFDLYVQILVPDVPDIKKDIIVEVNNVTLDPNIEWKSFYEEYGRDYYYQGPEMEINVTSGTYKIKVSNPTNTGKYVLVIGREEKFPINEIVKTIITLPILKHNFFEKSWITSFTDLFWVYFIILLVILLSIFIFIRKIFKK